MFEIAAGRGPGDVVLILIAPGHFAADTAYFFADQRTAYAAELGLLFARRHAVLGDVGNDASRGPLRNFCGIAVKGFTG